MPKRSSKRDINEKAFEVVQKTTAEQPVNARNKNPAAVALGRLGGLKGGKARADKLSRQQRSEIAKNAAKARWKNRETE